MQAEVILLAPSVLASNSPPEVLLEAFLEFGVGTWQWQL
jgi:hypothetical protein